MKTSTSKWRKNKCWTKYIIYSNSSCNFKQTKNFSLSSVEVYFLCLVPVQKSWVTSDFPSHCDVEQGDESATKKQMIWMKELEDKGLGTTHQLRSIISAVLQWIPHIFKYIVHNKVFSFIQFSFLTFPYLFSCPHLIFCYFIFYGQSCSWSASYTAKVSLAKILWKYQAQFGTNERDFDHIICSKSGETICIHISFCSVDTMESLWPTENLLLSVHLGECWSIILQRAGWHVCFWFRTLVKLHTEVIQGIQFYSEFMQHLFKYLDRLLKDDVLIIYILSSGKSAKGSDLQKSDLLNNHYYPAWKMLTHPDGPVEPLSRPY